MRLYMSAPPALSRTGYSGSAHFVTHDPPGDNLGSGGGTAHVLTGAWRAETGGSTAFTDWMESERHMVLHAGGQSRRLPAYAPAGKAILPIPVFRWSSGQRLDQTLMDLQTPLLRQLLDRAPKSMKLLVASGDVLVWNESALPALPDVDVLCLGLWDNPETATNHGVFFTPRSRPDHLSFMLQKPSPPKILDLSPNYLFLLDVGIWLFSARAVEVLMRRCGWGENDFEQGRPDFYDLYSTFGLALGESPTSPDPEVSALKAAVYPLNDAAFYHFGTNRDLVASALALQNRVHDPRRIRSPLMKPHPSLFVQNADTGSPLQEESRDIWIENSELGPDWVLREKHILTGIPANQWKLSLPAGICLDVVPVDEEDWVIRPYGFNDSFRGHPREEHTTWMEAPLRDWFQKRSLEMPEGEDIQDLPLFPRVRPGDLTQEWIQWMISPEGGEDFSSRWKDARRYSAAELADAANLTRLFADRKRRMLASLPVLARHAHRSVFYQVDLAHSAGLMDKTVEKALPQTPPDPQGHLFAFIHDRMLHAEYRRQRGNSAPELEAEAFSALREAMIAPCRDQSLHPRNTLLSDQVIWARSPVRLDLAGGWTDTPPYCFLHGGQVVNLAVELNGQPPIQVFVRTSETPRITLRSIDLGKSEILETYEDIAEYKDLGSGFSIPKAALALCGFLPEFQQGTACGSLKEQLSALGGGIELSLLCAIPKGSGLGTSSVLAASVLGALSELFGYGWDTTEICNRTLVLEQMLTSGGGWQDQFGGVTRGLKYLRTRPGLDQSPELRWLPDYVFTDPLCRENFLLYYTGITRLAKSLLSEIVRGMFLNKQEVLRTLSELGYHAREMYETLQHGSYTSLAAGIERTWELNQSLDPGTNPPGVRALLDPLDDYLLGKKLLGAGGGGYVLMLAKDPRAAARVRSELEASPPNSRARFVEMRLSRRGLQVTRS